MTTIHKGTIIWLHGSHDSGLAFLEVDDERDGRIFVPCDNAWTVRYLDSVFGDVITKEQTFNPEAITGKEIYFGTDYLGILVGFSPVDEADEEIVAEYERTGRGKKTGNMLCGFVPPDDPIYALGPIAAGRRIFEPPKKTFH